MKRTLLVIIMVLLVVGTATASLFSFLKKKETSEKKKAVSVETARLNKDLKRLCAFSAQLARLEAEMNKLVKEMSGNEDAHFSADEHDKIESLLFRYLACRQAMWDMIIYYEKFREDFKESDQQTEGFFIGFGSAAHLVYYSSTLVKTFLDEPDVKAKLNEEFYRSNIKRGTYDLLFKAVTNVENIQKFRASWKLFQSEMRDRDSSLYKVVNSSRRNKELYRKIKAFARQGEKRTDYVLKESAMFSPSVRNKLRNSSLQKYAEGLKKDLGDNVSTIRGLLFVNVSRLRLPGAVVMKMSDEQIQYLRKVMKPGDLIMTFSDGYMSNIFLPGAFKHGITYVGLPPDRKRAGMDSGLFKGLPKPVAENASKSLDYEQLPDKRKADLIEAVAEGVIFNSLEEITDKHISRMVVLRPAVSRKERLKQLKTVFALLGNTYDFEFDFESGSHQCCTEVIYRSLHKTGPVDFKLTKRMGVMTLSADDIINYHLNPESKALEFVLLAEASEGSEKSGAVILEGGKGETRLKALMKP